MPAVSYPGYEVCHLRVSLEFPVRQFVIASYRKRRDKTTSYASWFNLSFTTSVTYLSRDCSLCPLYCIPRCQGGVMLKRPMRLINLPTTFSYARLLPPSPTSGSYSLKKLSERYKGWRKPQDCSWSLPHSSMWLPDFLGVLVNLDTVGSPSHTKSRSSWLRIPNIFVF